MHALKIALAVCLTWTVAGCGGTAGSSTSAPVVPPTSYAFVVPALNSVRTYSETIIDNGNNTINLSYTDTVTSTSANGNFVVLQQDPNNYSVTVNGSTYSIATESITVNKSDQPLSAINSSSGVTCTDSPYGAGPPFPLTIGQSWSNAYTVTCGSNAAIAYQQSGSVVDLESVTVPAGTYSALKLQSTLSHTDANGTIYSQLFATWRDAATGVLLKQQVFTTYGGTAPVNGYPITDSIVLQSGTP